VAADPFRFLALSADAPDTIGVLQSELSAWQARHREELPPFQGGVAGLFSYDLHRSIERIAASRVDEFQVPALAVGFYDVVVAFDHQQGRGWIVSQGRPEGPLSSRLRYASDRLEYFASRLRDPTPARYSQRPASVLTREQLARQFAAGDLPQLTSNFSADGYLDAVGRTIEYIRAGDVFQVNLAQRLLYPAHGSSVDLYQRLRKCNPAPFAGYFDLGEFQIVSASPERFLSVRNGVAEARPIKGTRLRCRSPEADLFAAGDLLESEKDRAENVMIVDLLRNDLSRVCRPDSVCVNELCRVETYQYVQHLVSVIRGELAPGYTALDLVRAAFPGGSITGAPKVRAMEIIQELEPTARGPYCGSLGYVGCDGTLDLSILIRTITAGRGWWQLPVGGGIVAQSEPAREYEETWHKAVGMLRALRP
jgi:para-aminobenzoate synthetase component 1